MARTYKRDKNGRFASTGGSGKAKAAPTSKAGMTRAANTATAKRLADKGMTGIGGRLAKKNASLYQGTKATKRNRAADARNRDENQKEQVHGYAWGAHRSKSKMRGMIKAKRR